MPLRESRCRSESWVEGTWITLADWQSWCFPPCEAVPGHAEMAKRAAKSVVDDLMPLLNIGALKAQGLAIAAGDPSVAAATIRKLGRMMGIHRAGFRIACELLTHNYKISQEDCERLMPFNYQVSELSDPDSNVNTATPQLLAIFNSVLSISGVDLDSEFSRIGLSN